MLMGIERIILHAPANQPPPPRCRHEEEGASASVPDTNDSAAMIGGTSGSGTKMMDPSSAVEDGHHDDDDEDRATARVRRQGRVDGLFRACMDVIRSSHTLGRALRTAMLAAGFGTTDEGSILLAPPPIVRPIMAVASFVSGTDADAPSSS